MALLMPSLRKSFSHGSLWPCSCPGAHLPPSTSQPKLLVWPAFPLQFCTDSSLGREVFCLLSFSLALKNVASICRVPAFWCGDVVYIPFPFHFSELFKGEMSSYLKSLFLGSLALWVRSTRDTLDGILFNVRLARGRPGPMFYKLRRWCSCGSKGSLLNWM